MEKVLISDPESLTTRVFEDYKSVVIPIEGTAGDELIRKLAKEQYHLPGILGQVVMIDFSTKNGITYIEVNRG